MPTPSAPRDAVESATLRLNRTPDIGRPDPRVISIRTDPALPRVPGYEILSIVGYGGMAIVYEARHLKLNRRVALKMLRGDALADPEYRERFRAEAEAIARLQHPNVIQVFEVGAVEAHAGETHPGPFLALEFVDGGSLTQHTYTPHPPREAARTVETLARAAHAAHRLGVIHRDLKPANVLLTRDGVPKIADFGIAKRIDAEAEAAARGLTRDGTVMGTPEYMAPEQLCGQTATPTIDVYALGVILYELLTARVPFQGATFADTMVLTMYQEPVPPRRLQPAVPRDLETICLKCLEKSPAKRYASAEGLADDLARWADGREIRARAIGPAGRTVRWARRNPAVAALSLLVLLVALTGLGGIVWQWNDARANAREAKTNAEDAGRNAVAAQNKSDEAVRNADKERYERYRMSVFAASGALRLHDATGAGRALESAPLNHRDWVWHHLSAQLDRSREVIDTGGPFGNASFTPDGRRVLLSEHGDVRVWDVTTRTALRSPEPLSDSHHSRISPDGTAIARVTGDHKLRTYNVDPWGAGAVIDLPDVPLHTIEFSSDSKRLITIAPGGVRIWDAGTGKELHRVSLPADVCGPMCVSPDHLVLAACRVGKFESVLLDVQTGRELTRLGEHEGLIRGFRFSPAGDWVVSYTEYPTNSMRLWEVSTGRLLATLDGHENQINNLHFDECGEILVSGSTDRSVRLWDLSGPLTGRPLSARWVRKDHTGRIETVTISPDRKRVVSTSFDRTLRYWDAATGEPVAVLQGHSKLVVGACYSADGKDIVSASADGTLRVWGVAELDDDYALRGHTKFVYSVASHPDGVRIASSGWDGTARVWDAATRTELARLSHGPTADSLTVSAVAYHPTGRYLATLCRDDFVRLWDAETGKELHRWPTAARNWTDSRLVFSPDGNLLAAGGWDGCVRLWDVGTRAEVARLRTHKVQIRDVAFSPDGKRLAVAGEVGDATVRIWDVAARKELHVLTGHTASVYALTWNRAGTLLASGSLDDTVRLWDTTTWKLVGEPLWQGANVYSVAFHPEGKLLAAACADNLIRVWNVETQQELAELSGHSNYVHSLAFSPDGARLVSASGDKTVRVWDSRPPKGRPTDVRNK